MQRDLVTYLTKLRTLPSLFDSI